MNLEEQIKNLNLSLSKEKKEAAKEQAPPVSESAPTLSSEEISAQLWELKTQTLNIPRYQEEIDRIKAKTPPKQENTQQNKYNEIKSKSKCTAFTTLSLILSIIAVIGYIAFCVLDAKKGWAIFYPKDGVFTLI